ncbi:hypothetical protein [Clostridium thermopalmarium]|uniref:Dnd system-associated protein 4 n=1 Tax=Clostridium thermopalmarium DSM 5974 TaxID=1121340 RepID=A0A2T0AN72_9CLOT|nr:hypothetical protein [Clostridium thermopalmarium]PRR70319.1 hypothetical protein CPAL_22710 [Clostridium thermopalmarium DSM 5974]PVZ20855.1 dnd system-associated protein 4 [Clostridium thermopalmarium DSM 5974]
MAVFNKESEKEYIFKNLGKPDGNTEKLFETMKDVYMLAFILGVRSNESTPIVKKSQDPIKDIYFSEDDKGLMDLVALYLYKDIKILDRKEDSENYIRDLVERYTNFGIDELNNGLNSEHFNLDALISMVMNYRNYDEPKKANLADLIYEMNKNI